MSPTNAVPSGATSPPQHDATSYQRLREHLAYLELTAASEHLAAELDRGLAEQASPTQILERLLELEVAATRARRQRARLRFARYPVYKTLAGFDFDFQPQLDRALVAELSTLRFVEERRNVLLLGPPGVGKSHLAIALGIAATEAGYRTFFTTAADMVHTLQAAHVKRQLFLPTTTIRFADWVRARRMGVDEAMSPPRRRPIRHLGWRDGGATPPGPGGR